METLYILIPAYNEEENIEHVIREWYSVLTDKGENSRLVINYSGSTDSTLAITERLKSEFPLLETMGDSVNSYGAKVLDLYRYAVDSGADWIFQTDSDGQTDPLEFDGFWKKRGDFDAVIGNRVRRDDGGGRAFVEKVVTRLVKHYFHVNIPDANAPFRLISSFLMRNYLEIIPCDYSMPNILFTAMFAAGRENVAFEEISFGCRRGGKNTMNYRKIFRTGCESLKNFKALSGRFVKAGKLKVLFESIRFYGIPCLADYAIRKFKAPEEDIQAEGYCTYQEPLYRKRSEYYYKGKADDGLRYLGFKNMKIHMNIDEPVTFCEKIQWLKLHDATPLKTELTDKYLAKRWIAEQVGEEYVIPTYGVWDKADEIDYESLPEQFVLKTNHSCRTNIFVRDRKLFDKKKAAEKLEIWRKSNFAFAFYELQYLNIDKKIFAEKCLPKFMIGSREYKFMCMDGEIAFVYDFDGGDPYYTTLYDENWNKLDWTTDIEEAIADKPVEPPHGFEEMKNIARKLSKGFSFVRVDLYLVGEKIYVGEMTFTPASGYNNFSSLAYDIELGRKISINTAV